MQQNLAPPGLPRRPARSGWMRPARSLFAAAVLAIGCGFSPVIPDGTIVCSQDTDCPAGLVCSASPANTASRLCCRGGSCPVPGSEPGDPGRSSPADGGSPAPSIGGTGGTPRPEPSRPAGGELDPVSGVTCQTGNDLQRPLFADEKLHCTIAAEDSGVGLGVDLIARNDPTTIFTSGSCQANLRLAEEAVDPVTGLGRPLGQATIDKLVLAVQRMQRFCEDARGTLVGMVAGSWARKASNVPDVSARLLAETGLTLDVPSESEELARRYLGAARNRLGRIVYDEWLDVPEILIWPTDAAAPTRYTVPMSFSEVGSAYLSNAENTTFNQTRTALRGRLNNIRYVMVILARRVAGGTLSSSVAIGPTTNATIPLAVKGELRDATDGWYEPQRYQAKIDQARVALSPQGWIFGTLTPAEIDAFFPSINAREFMQLRTDPVLRTYGEWVTLSTSILDMLGKEARATEFVFTMTNAYFGYLFSKLFSAPARM
jgi:hypothetical protein